MGHPLSVLMTNFGPPKNFEKIAKENYRKEASSLKSRRHRQGIWSPNLMMKVNARMLELKAQEKALLNKGSKTNSFGGDSQGTIDMLYPKPFLFDTCNEYDDNNNTLQHPEVSDATIVPTMDTSNAHPNNRLPLFPLILEKEEIGQLKHMKGKIGQAKSKPPSGSSKTSNPNPRGLGLNLPRKLSQ